VCKKQELRKCLRGLVIKYYASKNQANITNLFEENIILPLLNSEDVSKLPTRNVAFYQLKQCHLPHGLNLELQNVTFPSLSPLATKHYD
jgi:hypothetical protein